MWNDSSVGFGGGGGFMDDSMQGGTSKKGPQNNDKTIVPVLIKHIMSISGDLQIAGRTVNKLTFVGVIRRIEQDTTKISFSIQDDTGVCFDLNRVKLKNAILQKILIDILYFILYFL